MEAARAVPGLARHPCPASASCHEAAGRHICGREDMSELPWEGPGRGIGSEKELHQGSPAGGASSRILQTLDLGFAEHESGIVSVSTGIKLWSLVTKSLLLQDQHTVLPLLGSQGAEGGPWRDGETRRSHRPGGGQSCLLGAADGGRLSCTPLPPSPSSSQGWPRDTVLVQHCHRSRRAGFPRKLLLF